jgi:hypothetical protein
VDAQRWLEELRAELERRRLPPPYVERLASELSDHLTDFLEDRMSTDAKDLRGVIGRLGSPSRVASAAAAEYRRGRFSARHPVVTFLVMPVVSLPVLWIACIAGIVATLKLLGLESGSPASTGPVAEWAWALVPYLVVGLLLMPAALSAVFFCRLANKAALSWKWSMATCALLAVFGGLAALRIVLPRGSLQGQIAFGFSLNTHPSASQILQFLLPLTIGGLAAWRRGSSSLAPLPRNQGLNTTSTQ